jgi:hypothetical protein
MAVNWRDNPDLVARLVACDYDELEEAFPGVPRRTLLNRRNEFRKQLDLVPERNHRSGDTVKTVEREAEGRDGESTVPLSVYNRVLKQLYDAKRSREDYLETLHTAVADAMAAYEVGVVPAPPRQARKTTGEEVCVPLLSDIQLAKVTPDYNTAVAEERLYEYARKIVKLANVQRSDHSVNKCHVMALGDIVEGLQIFPGQQWLVDAGLYRQICVDGPRLLTGFFRHLLANFDEVECTWVIGNHGRIGRRGDFDPETNGDRMLGSIVKLAMEGEPRFKLNMPDGHGERNWYAIAQEGNWRALLFHGDQIRGHSGIPFYGFHKSVAGWASGGLPAPDHEFQTALCGHFHQATRLPINKREVYINGSLESMNTYASEQLKAMSDPQQWTLFVSPERGKITASYLVDLV